MREWLKKYDVLLRLLCFFAALMLWLFVVNLDNPEITTEYKNIKVNLTGAPELLEERGLSILEGSDATVNVRVKARMDEIYQIGSAENIIVTADLSSIKTAGTHQLDYTVALPSRGAVVVSSLPTYITVMADKIITAEIPVRVVAEGEPADGYVYGECNVSSDYITVEGPDRVLGQVAAARVRVDAQKLRETTSWNCGYALIDAAGEEIASEHIVKVDQTVSVTLPVMMAKEVPLTVEWIAAPGIDPVYASAKIVPATVRITGSASILETVNQISLGTINLMDAENGQKHTFSIILPNGISGIDAPASAEATISLSGVETREFTGTAQLPSPLPEGASIKVPAPEITVQVRGHYSVLELIKAEDILLTIQPEPRLWTSEDGSIIPGEYTVPVKAQLEEGSAAAVIGSYQTVVEVSAS